MSIIQSLEISNFQRVTAAKIEPTGSLIVLAGQNANGKTSVLDAIETTLCGFNARNTKRPIKDGHGKASIDIVLSDGTVVRRTFTPSGSTLSGTRPDGGKLKQADLNAIISQLGVDASTFATSGEKDQLKTLLSVVDLPFVPAELESERDGIFLQRRDVNRDIAQLDAQLKSFAAAVAGLPGAEVSVAELNREYAAAVDNNESYSRAAQRVSYSSSRLAQIKQELAEAEAEDALATAAYAAHPEPVNIDDLRERIAAAEETNAAVRAEDARKTVASRLAAATGAAEALTKQLVEIDQTKKDGLAAVEMPIEGLTFDEEGVLYQGIPFSRASGAEQIIVSAAMIIATDPELRTMVIRNGNVLDAASMETLEHMLEDNNFLAFIEYVSDGEDHEFRLVDGELAQ